MLALHVNRNSAVKTLLQQSKQTKILDYQTRSTAVQCLNDLQQTQPKIQETKTDMTASYSGDESISPPKITTSQTGRRLVRDETTKDLHMPLSSTIVLKRKKRNAV